MTRRLSLRAERLPELTTDELTTVVGGLPTNPCPYTLGLCFVRTRDCVATLPC